jgi:hypothetical protein
MGLIKRIDELYALAEDATSDLARSETITPSFRTAVASVRDAVNAMTLSDQGAIDPYLLESLHNGLLDAWAALDEPEAAVARRRARVALERIRVALRDVAEDRPVAASADVQGAMPPISPRKSSEVAFASLDAATGRSEVRRT